jgi:hypothetical protein
MSQQPANTYIVPAEGTDESDQTAGQPVEQKVLTFRKVIFFFIFQLAIQRI